MQKLVLCNLRNLLIHLPIFLIYDGLIFVFVPFIVKMILNLLFQLDIERFVVVESPQDAEEL